MKTIHRTPDRTILLFHQVNRSYHNANNSLMARNNLQDVNNPMLLFVLAWGLEQEDAAVPSQKELARLLHVTPATVANSLKSLERGGYVRKETNPADARRKQVFITEKGRQAVAACTEIFDIVDRQALRGFSPEEREQLRNLHRRMLNNLRQIGGDCGPCCPPVPPPFHGPISNGKD